MTATTTYELAELTIKRATFVRTAQERLVRGGVPVTVIISEKIHAPAWRGLAFLLLNGRRR